MHILNEHINENHLSLARQQEPSDNLPPDDEVDETPQEPPIDDITTSSSSAPFLAAHSSAHSTIDPATVEPIALSTPEVATPNTTNHIGNLPEVSRDTSQNGTMNLFHLKDTGIFSSCQIFMPEILSSCFHYSRQGHPVALSSRQTGRAVQDRPN